MERVHDFIEMSPRDFASLGMYQVAYVRPVEVDGKRVFAICAADGTEMAVVPQSRDVAFATVRQNDLEPCSVH